MITPRLAALALLALTGCVDPTGGADGRLTGRLDATPWTGDARFQVPPGVGPVIYSETRDGSGRTIGVKVPHTAAGTYPIPANAAWYAGSPRDVAGDQYVAHAAGGTLVVTRIDEREIAGRLEITFTGPGNETLRFTDGSFVARRDRGALH